MLVADDEFGVRKALKRGLAAEGMDVALTADGPSTLRAALTGAFDIVLLDIMLPGLSGYRILERMRAEGVHTPVLLISAKDGEYDQADGFDLGADGYLVKPFSYRVLVAQVNQLLRRVGGRGAQAGGPGRRSGGRPGASAGALVGFGAGAEPARVRGARRAGRPGGRGGHQGRPAPRGLGRRTGGHPQRGRGLRRLPAPQAGGGGRWRAVADRARARLPAQHRRTRPGACEFGDPGEPR